MQAPAATVSSYVHCSAVLGDTASLQASTTFTFYSLYISTSYSLSAPSNTKIPEPQKEEKKMPHLGPSIPQFYTLCILVSCSLLYLSLATASRSFSDKMLWRCTNLNGDRGRGGVERHSQDPWSLGRPLVAFFCVCVYQLGCLCLSINSVRKVAPLSLVYSFTPLSIYISVCLRVLVSFTG